MRACRSLPASGLECRSIRQAAKAEIGRGVMSLSAPVVIAEHGTHPALEPQPKVESQQAAQRAHRAKRILGHSGGGLLHTPDIWLTPAQAIHFLITGDITKARRLSDEAVV